MTYATGGRRRAAFAAIVCIILFFILGFLVQTRVPDVDVRIEKQNFATIVPLAIPLTELGTVWALVKIGVVLLIIALVAKDWRKRIVFSLGALIIVHFLSDWTKGIFHRARPEHWLAVHETSYSYPSGHAATATVLFALWAYWILRELRLTPRIRALLGAVVGGLAYGICWSRLVLGAHWPTDLVGGILLGLAVIFAGHALIADVTPSLEEE